MGRSSGEGRKTQQLGAGARPITDLVSRHLCSLLDSALTSQVVCGQTPATWRRPTPRRPLRRKPDGPPRKKQSQKRKLQRKWWLGSRQPRRPCQRRRQRENPRPSGRQRPEHGSDGRRPRQMLRRLTRATPTPWRLSRRRSRAAPRPPLKFDECREGSWRGRAVTYHTPVSFNKRVAAFETESNRSDASVIARNEKRPAAGRSERLRSWIDYIG